MTAGQADNGGVAMSGNPTSVDSAGVSAGQADEIWRGNELAGAVYSKWKGYRYRLWRRWDRGAPVGCFLMLNPSTATELVLDPTVTRCQRYLERWGYGGMEILNLFAYRATDPLAMKAQADPVGPGNDAHIRAVAAAADLVVCAWGTHGAYQGRAEAVRDMLLADGVRLYALRLTKTGQPSHPLYLPGDLNPLRWQ